MTQDRTVFAGAVVLCLLAQVPANGAGLQQGSMVDTDGHACVVELDSSPGESIQIQNLCRNPMAVRINWGDGRLFDYCLNSNGEVRSVARRTADYHLIREQEILLCH